MLSGQAGDVMAGRPLTSENSFELQIQAQRKHLPISYLTCNGQHAFCLIRGTSNTQNQGLTCDCMFYNISGGLRKSFLRKQAYYYFSQLAAIRNLVLEFKKILTLVLVLVLSAESSLTLCLYE